MSAKEVIGWLTLAVLLVTLWPLCTAAQDGQLTMFHGGDYRSHMLISNGLLFGMGSKTPALGGTCSGLEYGVEDLYWNPARLGFLGGSQAMLDLTPPFLVLDANTFVDLNQAAAEATDDLVAEAGSDDLVLTQDDYPHIEAAVEQNGFVHNGALALPLGGWGVGLGLYQPLNVQLNSVGTGLQARGYGQDEEDPQDNVDVIASADMSLLLDIQVNALSFGLGKEILPRWCLGLAIDRYYGHSSANGRLQLEGIVLRAGRETAFNDAADPWPNDLYQEMVGSYGGTAWGFKVGTSYRLRHNLSLDGMFVLPTELRFGGEMDIVQHTVPGVDPEGEELVDVDEIDEDEPTRTQVEDNPTADQVVIDVPGALKLGGAWRVRFLTAILQYAHYFGDLSCVYSIEEAETPVAYNLGMKPRDALTLGLDFWAIRLSGGFVLGKSMYQRDPQKENDAPQEKRLLVPTFTLGTGFGLGERYGVDLLLISVPAGVMRVTTTCHF